MNRALILTVNGVLLLACCYVAGGLIADVAGAVLAPAQIVDAPPSSAGAPPERRWEDRQTILTRNLFNASTLAPQAAAPVEEAESYDKTRLPLRLLGTVAATDPARAWAAVEDLEKREQRVVRVGDRLKDRADVLRIERRRIVLQNGPRREELSLEEENPADGPPTRPGVAQRGPVASPRNRPVAARPSPAAKARVQRLAENRFAVQRNDVNAISEDPSALFSQARILPKYGEDGQMTGVQLNAIKPGSLFQQIGIQDGDTITELNGIRVDGQQASLELLQELTRAQAFQVTVTGRDGSQRTLEYEVQ